MDDLTKYRLVFDLFSNIIVFNQNNNVAFAGDSIKQELTQSGIDLEKIKTDNFSGKEGKKLLQALNKVRKTQKSQIFSFDKDFKQLFLFPARGKDKDNVILSLKSEIDYILKIEHDLRERVKELNCLYMISKEIDRSENMDDTFQKCTDIIKNAFQFPEITSVIIDYGGEKYISEGGREEEIKALLNDESILKHDRFDGEIKVIYHEDKPFLKEEVNLIKEVSRKFRKTLERKRKEAANLSKSDSKSIPVFNPDLYDSLRHKADFRHIITQSQKMFKIFHIVEKYALTDNSVLIWGESGTGKELIAKAIHKISDRRDNKFIAVNAGLLAHELFASEFFGHEKGAFTGAVAQKKGFIEEADGGTLFLDEIGELDLQTQVKLLRVLQEKEFYKLGSTRNIKVDVRIIASTNKYLFEEINKGTFRKDLFFRLNINSIELPPLRERGNDIEVLLYHFLDKFNKKYNKNISRISNTVMALLKSYTFPGNVRELMNIINSAVIVEANNEIRRKSLPNYFWEHNMELYPKSQDNVISSLESVEKNQIKRVLEYTNNNRSKSAEILGISRVNLIAKIKKYDL